MTHAGSTMTLIGMVNPPTSRYAAGWSHPDARNDWLGADFYVDVARSLERGGFDLMFLPDTLAVPEDGAGDVSTTLDTGGKGAIQLDPVVTLATVAAATSTIGLGCTVSTGFLPPYQIARSLLSLDHLSGGRCAWNVVTSTTDAEARNMGRPGIADKATRYDHADAVVAQVLELMTSWEDGALLLDAGGGQFADADRVHRARLGSAPGPMTLPRSPQGHPVLMQAGASERGLDFAARWAEVVFVAADGLEATAAVRDDIRGRAADLGRDPDDVRVCAAVQPVVGATPEDAGRIRRGLKEGVDEPLALRAVARLLHADPTELEPEAAAVDLLDRHRGATGSAGFEQMLRSACVRGGLTVRELAVGQALNQLTPEIVGDGEQVADELCRWQDAGAADGFVVLFAVHPTSVDTFTEHVGPVLRRRGRVPESTTPTTLRDRMALPRR